MTTAIPTRSPTRPEELSVGAFNGPGQKNAIRSRLEEAEVAIKAGETERARRLLENLRRRLDGCEAGSGPDNDDWIVDCEAQDEIRALLDTLLGTLP